MKETIKYLKDNFELIDLSYEIKEKNDELELNELTIGLYSKQKCDEEDKTIKTYKEICEYYFSLGMFKEERNRETIINEYESKYTEYLKFKKSEGLLNGVIISLNIKDDGTFYFRTIFNSSKKQLDLKKEVKRFLPIGLTDNDFSKKRLIKSINKLSKTLNIEEIKEAEEK